MMKRKVTVIAAPEKTVEDVLARPDVPHLGEVMLCVCRDAQLQQVAVNGKPMNLWTVTAEYISGTTDGIVFLQNEDQPSQR